LFEFSNGKLEIFLNTTSLNFKIHIKNCKFVCNITGKSPTINSHLTFENTHLVLLDHPTISTGTLIVDSSNLIADNTEFKCNNNNTKVLSGILSNIYISESCNFLR
jgi:hypothetical protein